jgi:hypothetical protein
MRGERLSRCRMRAVPPALRRSLPSGMGVVGSGKTQFVSVWIQHVEEPERDVQGHRHQVAARVQAHAHLHTRMDNRW